MQTPKEDCMYIYERHLASMKLATEGSRECYMQYRICKAVLKTVMTAGLLEKDEYHSIRESLASAFWAMEMRR